MKNRILRVSAILTLLLLIGLCYAYGATHWGWWIPCVFREVTGLQCPGCGVSRMCLAVFQGDIIGAFHWNPVLFIISPFLIYMIGYVSCRYIRYGDMHLMKWQEIVCWIVLLILILFAVLRNLS